MREMHVYNWNAEQCCKYLLQNNIKFDVVRYDHGMILFRLYDITEEQLIDFSQINTLAN